MYKRKVMILLSFMLPIRIEVYSAAYNKDMMSKMAIIYSNTNEVISKFISVYEEMGEYLEESLADSLNELIDSCNDVKNVISSVDKAQKHDEILENNVEMLNRECVPCDHYLVYFHMEYPGYDGKDLVEIANLLNKLPVEFMKDFNNECEILNLMKDMLKKVSIQFKYNPERKEELLLDMKRIFKLFVMHSSENGRRLNRDYNHIDVKNQTLREKQVILLRQLVNMDNVMISGFITDPQLIVSEDFWYDFECVFDTLKENMKRLEELELERRVEEEIFMHVNREDM